MQVSHAEAVQFGIGKIIKRMRKDDSCLPLQAHCDRLMLRWAKEVIAQKKAAQNVASASTAGSQ